MNDQQPAVARFDPTLDAWVLSSYDDVSRALREPELAISDTGPGADHAHLAVREAGADFAHARLGEWRSRMEQSAAAMAARLAPDQPVDLFRSFAAPWALEVACAVTEVDRAQGERGLRIAGEVFLAAATATGPGADSHALDAAAELARNLPPAPMAVQGFVALSHTLPHFLASAWLTLISHPEAVLHLRANPAIMPDAVEEMLRLASPSRAVFRKAIAPVTIGPATISRGDSVILLLAAANRDSERFAHPDQLDFARGGNGHLAFGKGAHACAGAHLIRLATSIATGALLASTSAMELGGEVGWVGGFAIRAPGALPVIIRR